jgi:cytochrome b561
VCGSTASEVFISVFTRVGFGTTPSTRSLRLKYSKAVHVRFYVTFSFNILVGLLANSLCPHAFYMFVNLIFAYLKIPILLHRNITNKVGRILTFFANRNFYNYLIVINIIHLLAVVIIFATQIIVNDVSGGIFGREEEKL